MGGSQGGEEKGVEEGARTRESFFFFQIAESVMRSFFQAPSATAPAPSPSPPSSAVAPTPSDATLIPCEMCGKSFPMETIMVSKEERGRGQWREEGEKGSCCRLVVFFSSPTLSLLVLSPPFLSLLCLPGPRSCMWPCGCLSDSFLYTTTTATATTPIPS